MLHPCGWLLTFAVTGIYSQEAAAMQFASNGAKRVQNACTCSVRTISLILIGPILAYLSHFCPAGSGLSEALSGQKILKEMHLVLFQCPLRKVKVHFDKAAGNLTVSAFCATPSPEFVSPMKTAGVFETGHVLERLKAALPGL